MKSQTTVSDLIQKYYAAYEQKDRKTIEPLLTDDFSFSSPHDDHIDRASYFSRCWPNSEAFVLYELEPATGAKFRNTEFFRIEGNKIREVEVYFGSPIGSV